MHITSPGQPDTSWQLMEVRWVPSDAYNHRFVALQTIFNRQKESFGYEALSRSGWDNRFTGDPATATQRMIEEWMHYGLEALTGGSPTFLNCTREDLLGDLLQLLPTSVVLEVLETVEPDKEVLGACRKMKGLGYQIALDNFQLCKEMEGWIELADYVKVDFRLSGKERRDEILSYPREKATLLVAEKLETQEEFETALEEGFELFQGYYLSRPALFAKQRVLLS